MTDVLVMAEQMEVPVQHIFSSIRRRGLIADADAGRGAGSLRLSALMDLYIHPLYILVTKILSSILNSSALIHPLYYLLSTVGLTCL
jgi:hypothetical protein